MGNLALQIIQSNIGDPNVGANILFNTTIPLSEESKKESILVNLNLSYDILNTFKNFSNNVDTNEIDIGIIEEETPISWLDTLYGISNFNIAIPLSEDNEDERTLTLGVSGNPFINVIKDEDFKLTSYASINFINSAGSLTNISLTCDNDDTILSLNCSSTMTKKVSGFNVTLNALLVRTISLNNQKPTIPDNVELTIADISNLIIGGRFKGFIRQITIPLDKELTLLITITIGLE